MLLRRVTDFILQGRSPAMVAAFACAASSLFTMTTNSTLLALLVLVVSTFSIVIVGLVTLRKGALEGAFVLGAATLPYAIGYVADPEYYALGLVWVSALLVFGSNVLTWIGAEVLRRTVSWSSALQILGLICVTGVCLVHLFSTDIPGWWATQLTDSFTKALEMAGLSDPKEVAMQQTAISDTVARIKPYATLFAAVFVWLNAVWQLLLARWWQAIVFNPGGLQKELYEIRMGRVAGVLFIIGLILSYWQNNAWLNDAMPILYVMFGVAGLSLVHKIAASKPMGWFMLILFYAAIPLTVIIIPIMALLDVWLNLRERFEKQV